jgi:CheY-like chemotaxis protein
MKTSPGRTIVLIVEDEPLIRMDVAEYVNETGFSALEAATGDEALVILSARTDIEVVFTDVNMPGEIDGMELARLISDRWPHIAVIITSGMVRPRNADLSPRSLFFSKPYDLEHVVSTMRTLAA